MSTTRQPGYYKIVFPTSFPDQKLSDRIRIAELDEFGWFADRIFCYSESFLLEKGCEIHPTPVDPQPSDVQPKDDPIINHMRNVKLLQAIHGESKFYVECSPTDSGVIKFPNSNRAIKEIELPNFPLYEEKFGYKWVKDPQPVAGEKERGITITNVKDWKEQEELWSLFEHELRQTQDIKSLKKKYTLTKK